MGLKKGDTVSIIYFFKYCGRTALFLFKNTLKIYINAAYVFYTIWTFHDTFTFTLGNSKQRGLLGIRIF